MPFWQASHLQWGTTTERPWNKRSPQVGTLWKSCSESGLYVSLSGCGHLFCVLGAVCMSVFFFEHFRVWLFEHSELLDVFVESLCF